MPDLINPYKVLGLPDRADITECKEAYRKLVVKYHPDKNKSKEAHRKMLLINQCMDFLKDPQKKAQLDRPQPQPQRIIIQWGSGTATSASSGTVPNTWWWHY